MRLSFRVIFDIFFVKFGLFIVTFIGFSLISTYYFSGEIELIFNRLPYLILGVLTIYTIFWFIALGKKYNFKILKGIKLFLTSDFNIWIWTVTIIYVIGIIINFLDIIPKIRLFDVSPIFIFSLILLLFFMTLMYIMYFRVRPQTLIKYSFNILEEVFNNWRGKEYISILEKQKLFNAINIAYEIYVKEIKNFYGEKTVEILKYNEILKLTGLLTVIDNYDKKSLGAIQKILKKLENIYPKLKPSNFIEIMYNINELAQEHNVTEPLFVIKSKKSIFGKYVVMTFYFFNVLIALVNYLI